MACYFPSDVIVDKVHHDTQTVRCRKCEACKKAEAADWSIRAYHEHLSTSLPSWFVTLTYDRENLPGLWPDDPRPYGSLDRDDLYSFLKRARHHYDFRYMGCGEYGGTTHRPHYHLALIGLDPVPDLRHEITRKSGKVYKAPHLEELWNMGLVEVSSLSYAATRYIAGYVHKKASGPDQHFRYDTLDPSTGEIIRIEPEFRSQSRRPALGREWLEANYKEVYPRDYVRLNGQRMPVPRYYDRLMEKLDPELLEQTKYLRYLNKPAWDPSEQSRQHHVNERKKAFYGTNPRGN